MVGQDPMVSHALYHAALEKAVPHSKHTKFRLHFLSSPVRILDDGHGQVAGLELEKNTLVPSDAGSIRAIGTGIIESIPFDTVIYAIGDQIDMEFGLPVTNNQLIRHGQPRFPVEEISFEVECCPGIFTAGWARQASTGLVGVARRDGTLAAQAMLQFLDTLEPAREATSHSALEHLISVHPDIVRNPDIPVLEAAEKREAEVRGLEYFRFGTNAEMLQVIRSSRMT
jgi:ferredoxin--NADP+ reductase